MTMDSAVLQPAWQRMAILLRGEGVRSRGISFALHVSLFALLSLSIGWTAEEKQVEKQKVPVLQVTLMPGQRRSPLQPLVQVAAPQKVEAKVAEAPKVVEDRVDQESAQDGAGHDAQSSKETSTPSGGSQGDGLIWTPPAPTPNAAAAGVQAAGSEKRIVLPVVEMRDGSSAPQLLSYDFGRFNDASSVAEATRLTGAGSIMMNAMVDAEGKVSDCQIAVSSGSAVLDEKACLLIRSYRYRPAKDDRGNVRSASISEVLEWAKDGKFVSNPPSPAPASVSDSPGIRQRPPTGEKALRAYQ